MILGTVFVLVLVVIVCALCIFQAHALKPTVSVKGALQRAIEDSAFTPNQFKIYDLSTETVCNRLIVVAPFDWYVWAFRGEVYILSPERGTRCADYSAPAVQVFADRFVETCLTVDLDSILHQYVETIVPVMVPYEITERTFTILSALNLLFKRWIPLTTEDATTGQRKVRVGFLVRRPRSAPNGTTGRTISGREVIELTSGRTTNDSRLQRKVYQHMGAGLELPRAQDQTQLGSAESSSSNAEDHNIGKRQVYEPSDLFYPWETEDDTGRITRRLLRDPDRPINIVKSKPPIIRGLDAPRSRWMTHEEALAKSRANIAYWQKYAADRAAAAASAVKPVESATIEEISDDA